MVSWVGRTMKFRNANLIVVFNVQLFIFKDSQPFSNCSGLWVHDNVFDFLKVYLNFMHITFLTESYAQSLRLCFQLGIWIPGARVFINWNRFFYFHAQVSVWTSSLLKCWLIIFIYFSSASVSHELSIRIVNLQYLSIFSEAERGQN